MATITNILTQGPLFQSTMTKKAIPRPVAPTQLKLNVIKGDVTRGGSFTSLKITRLRPYQVVAASDVSADFPHEQEPSDVPLGGSSKHLEAGNSSVENMVREFYNCINNSNINRLEELVSEECCFRDFSFPQIFEGKQEVRDYFDRLSKSMDKNVKFQLEDVCEGKDLVACVTWHLEWNEDKIPFTRGCSFFKCTTEGEKVVIREAQVHIESPVKPGDIVLTLLSVVKRVFDDFPNFTKWFLRCPEALLQILLTIYNLVGAPFVNPLIVFYTHIWAIICNTLGCIIAFLRFITKPFQ